MSSYLRIQIDESFLEKAFKQIEQRLDYHEEMILELQRLIKDKPDRSELKSLHDTLMKEIESKTTELGNRIDLLENKLDKGLKDLEDKFEGRLLETVNMINNANKERFESLENAIPNSQSNSNSNINDRLQFLEDTVYKNGSTLHNTREHLQTVASSISLFNDTFAKLDETLPRVLNTSVTSVKNILQDLSSSLNDLKQRSSLPPEVIHVVSPAPAPSPPQKPTVTPTPTPKPAVTPTLPSVTPKLSVAQTPPTVTPMLPSSSSVSSLSSSPSTPRVQPAPSPTITYVQQNVDLSSYGPYPSVEADWRDPPLLPAITKFANVGESVDYLYKLIPKLQAHLSAIHGKIVSDDNDLKGKADKSLVEKMFEKFQSVIGDIAGRIDDLRDFLEQTATRDEINEIVRELSNQINKDSQTAVGAVKCMACGRDIPQVTGATTEEESIKLLGPPPNSIVFKARATNSMGLQFGSMDGFDSAIVETPRSVRSARGSLRVTRKAKSLIRHK
ncbi:hypothetical protein GPJ56_007472 [Histomonas meleagridis]|uniref:uncharacterized protein n=1 Tax=Histomonas meleagridis TaxID=135588 RepID=UPI0035599BA2|nr:hypothetical protein GPJ56_007472 [Histomonas meleagridis]KAH0804318.1 hypothetical protein GO595_003148 [Histomonas meleagridis]